MKYEDWKEKYIDAPKRSRDFGADVSKEYSDRATPGKGSVTQQNGFRANKHLQEIGAVNTLHKLYGGDFHLLDERLSPNAKSPDFLWNGDAWDLKSPSTPTDNAIEKVMRKGLGQIITDKGGLVIDFQMDDIDLDRCIGVANARMYRSIKKDTDIIFMHKGQVKAIRRYLKKRQK